MITISLCMIVRNEEKTLARCLETVKDIMDEIIIVDTGSTDQTKSIARQYTKWVYDFTWVDDFSKARNFSFAKATKEYVMWLDADDVIPEEEAQKLMHLKRTLAKEVDVVYMKYQLTIGGKGAPLSVFWRERLVRREKDYRWHDPVHEYLLCPGKTIRVDIAINHGRMHLPTTRNLEIFEKYIANGHKLSSRNLFYYANELFIHGKQEKAAIYYESYLETTGGLMSTYSETCMNLSKYYERIGDDKKSLRALLRYFEIDGPRAEICCQLGYYFKKRKKYDQAIIWFQLAPATPKPLSSIGEIKYPYWDYIPYMELCACYYRKGQIDQAILFNEKAASIRPKEGAVLRNRQFLMEENERIGEKLRELNEQQKI